MAAALFAFVNAQLGVGFTTGLMEKQVHEHGLTSLRLTASTCQLVCGVAWHKEHYLPQAARAFHQFLMEESAHRAPEAL